MSVTIPVGFRQASHVCAYGFAVALLISCARQPVSTPAAASEKFLAGAILSSTGDIQNERKRCGSPLALRWVLKCVLPITRLSTVSLACSADLIASGERPGQTSPARRHVLG